MSQLITNTEILDKANFLVRKLAKVRRKLASRYNKIVCAEIHIKQYEHTEQDIVSLLSPMFDRQIESAAGRLRTMVLSKSVKAPQDMADAIASQIFDPNEWQDELVNRTLPPMAVNMVRAIRSQLNLWGVGKAYSIVAKQQNDAFAQLVNFEDRGTTTATDWLQTQSDIELDEIDFNVHGRIVSMGIATELPRSMKVAIKRLLQETFAQPYWDNINRTTLGDIRQFLAVGIRDGVSIEEMSRQMATLLSEEGIYARRRARNIARTESGHALNGARAGAMSSLEADLAGQVLMKRVWLSVLGNTTRDTHAALDSVPADEENRWNLAGYQVRWPADIVLPPRERCNCQCTITIEFGM